MKYFGTDGFRGEANVSLNVVHAYKVGRFLGNYYKKNSGKKEKIVIGKDTRCSGDMFESALCAGITASGTDVYLMGSNTYSRGIIYNKNMWICMWCYDISKS